MTNGNDTTSTMWGIQHAVDRAVRGVAAAIAGTVDTFEGERRRRALETQFEALDDRAMADIGIVRGQVPAIASAGADAPQLLRCMAERLGVGAEGLVSDARLRREMEWNCVACANRSQCRRWLRSAKPADGWRMFCANAEALDRLSAARAGKR
jgi:uncharacterized protein YjiS (DUF1127 family)